MGRGFTAFMKKAGETLGVYKEKGRKTATQTGARREALRRRTSKPGIAAFVKKAAEKGLPKGAGAQFRTVEQGDIEQMINPGFAKRNQQNNRRGK